jgi:hypothetical protein
LAHDEDSIWKYKRIVEIKTPKMLKRLLYRRCITLLLYYCCWQSTGVNTSRLMLIIVVEVTDVRLQRCGYLLGGYWFIIPCIMGVP